MGSLLDATCKSFLGLGRAGDSRLRRGLLWLFLVFAALVIPGAVSANEERRSLPSHVPPKRSSQIGDGFGINSDLPRDPYLPWNRRWWTRLFDAGFKWVRIGQYENSSDWTSWDRKRTRLNSSHTVISYAVFCLKKKTKKKQQSIETSNIMM